MEKESTKTNKTLISKKQLLAMIPLCERTIYNYEKEGRFPARIPLSPRKVAWDLSEVEEWIEEFKAKARKSPDNQADRPDNIGG